MNILVIGGGGREHTLCWKLKQSKHCKKLFAAPGNAGTSECATNLPIGVSDFKKIKEAVIYYQIAPKTPKPHLPLIMRYP